MATFEKIHFDFKRFAHYKSSRLLILKKHWQSEMLKVDTFFKITIYFKRFAHNKPSRLINCQKKHVRVLSETMFLNTFVKIGNLKSEL